MNGTPLEPARLADAPEIAALSRDWIEMGLPWRWRAGAVLRLLRDPDTAAAVARASGRIRGFSIMSFVWARREAHLVLIGVDPALRRGGLGAALHAWQEVLARRGGIARISLELRATRAELVGFYEGLGYRQTRRLVGYYQGREDALRMESQLRSKADTR